MKVVMGLSGGMDSATLLGKFLSENWEVTACSFTYGSKHNEYELKAAFNIVNFYKDKGFKVDWKYFNLTHAFQWFDSALLKTGEDIPEGHYNEESMKRTVVPGRNLIFASMMAGLAESIGAEHVALGVHSGDHHIYPDCRPVFIKALQDVVFESSDEKVKVMAPFLHEDKTSILMIGYSLDPQVPYHLTRTCYKNQELSCGKCGSCQERLEAFANIGITDPIEYMGDKTVSHE